MTQQLKSMKAGQSITVAQKFIVKRTGRNTWRLGEMMGDWLMSGTAEQVIEAIAER